MAVDRFLTLTDVSEILNITSAQTYALVRRGDLRAIKIGGRGQWRVERVELEAYITRMYDETSRIVAQSPADADETEDADHAEHARAPRRGGSPE